MVKKNLSKGKQRQSLRTSVSQKYLKANSSTVLGRRSKSFVPVVESVESEPDEDSTDVPHQSVESADEESHHSSASSSPERVSPTMTTRLAASQTRTSTPRSIVPSTLSSTISKWMTKKATTPNDQDARRLLGQLATVPLQGSSEYDKAHKEAVRGLTKVLPTSSSSKAKKKGKAVASVFKVSSIIFLPYGTSGDPPGSAGPDDMGNIRLSNAPNEAYIQSLERQHLAVRNIADGYQFDTSWSYRDICYYLRLHFPFLFRYFKEGPDTACYATESPFLIVHKNFQTLTAVPYDTSALDGEVLRRNCMVRKKGFQSLKLYFVTRHVIPLAVLMSWRRGEFITLPPSTPLSKRKRAPSTPITSDGEVLILEGGSILEMRSPPRKRVTRGGENKTSRRVENLRYNKLRSTGEELLASPTTGPGDDDASTDPNNRAVYLRSRSVDLPVVMDFATDVSDDVWEDYNPLTFGPDIAVPGASSSSASTSTGLMFAVASSEVNASADSGQREHTPLVDANTEVYLALSQQSFSDLNITRSEEDPYQADVDIAFDF